MSAQQRKKVSLWISKSVDAVVMGSWIQEVKLILSRSANCAASVPLQCRLQYDLTVISVGFKPAGHGKQQQQSSAQKPQSSLIFAAYRKHHAWRNKCLYGNKSWSISTFPLLVLECLCCQDDPTVNHYADTDAHTSDQVVYIGVFVLELNCSWGFTFFNLV